ncbi:SAM-dependent methyltransferase [Janthinobacterium fluminis]|uniref:SAM-dependent methyltransferase n=1 Tax=Janthinobacterium fluminis TaxID=2987524 RepID=A0ABT5JX12_9BURK|nr:SAM-dependent methyltransferase [Janthinobacterium fluminis]MDC8756703.1 SAM-dependent methyltransferase [Janthinobacterium fluminis]
MLLKIGELAKRAGLTVRTLHHYDSIGLLTPSVRSDKGFRLYNQDDVVRLHRIHTLKQLGCSLADIGALLDEAGLSPIDVITHQIAAIDEQVQRGQRLGKRLRHMLKELSDGRDTSIADWLTILEKMTMYEKYFSSSELDALRARKDEGGKATDSAWAELVPQVRDALEQRLPATGVQAQALARRWMQLLDRTTGGDIGLAIKLQTMQKSEIRAQQGTAITEPMMVWIQQAHSSLRASLFARHLAPAEFEQVRQRMAAHESDWHPLIEQLRQQMNAGAGLGEPAVQVLARRWETLFRSSYCGADTVLEAKVRAAFHAEPDLSSGIGVDAPLIAFVQQAIMQLHAPQDGAAAGPKPSAYMVAVQRGVHQLLDAPLVFDDPLALKILGPEDEASVRASAGRYADPMSKALRATLVVRSRLAEDAWARAEQGGVRQYVVLGAGLDTYACRGAARPDSRIFEVDLPATQQWKRGRLRAAGMAEPDGLSFVALDFKRSTLAAGLAEAGFRHDQPAFFSCLGVTMYLEQEEVYDTLRFIAAGAAGGGVVFDYGADPDLLGPMERTALQMMTSKAAERGETWKSYFDPAALDRTLREIGFAEVDSFSPQQLNERYLSGRQDGLKVGFVTRLAHARVC